MNQTRRSRSNRTMTRGGFDKIRNNEADECNYGSFARLFTSTNVYGLGRTCFLPNNMMAHGQDKEYNYQSSVHLL